jgi:hypothetical protein
MTSTYEFVGGPYDGQHREIGGAPLFIRFPVVSKIPFTVVVDTDLPVTAPRDIIHEYELVITRSKNPKGQKRNYHYQYVGIRDMLRGS